MNVQADFFVEPELLWYSSKLKALIFKGITSTLTKPFKVTVIIIQVYFQLASERTTHPYHITPYLQMFAQKD